MGLPVVRCKPEDKCGYTFIEKRGRNKRRVLTPEPYSKINSTGEIIIFTEDERRTWVKAYYQALEEMGITCYTHSKEVYHKVEDILKKTGNYRFL